MTPQASPLGRYDDSTGDEPLHEVQLLKLPVRVLAAGRQHHDELMHEFALIAVSATEPENVPKRFVDLVETLGTRYAATAERPETEVDAALERGDDTVDLVYHVPAHVVEAADRLARLMDEADEFCRAEAMLTLERTPVERAFAQWYLDEFRRQINGEPARPWDGPLDL